MSNDSLAGHPLIKLALENLNPLLDFAGTGLTKLAEKGKVRSEGNATLLEHEFYDDDVFRNAVSLIEAFDRLEQSQAIIEKAPKAAWESAGFDQHTWIEYHYSYYVVTLVSLVDIALVLTNAVFRLGNRGRDCKPDIIGRNWWVAQTPVRGALDELSRLVSPHKPGRNVHVHRGKLQPIAEVMGSEQLDQLKLFSFVQRVGKPVVDSARLDRAYAAEIQKISGRLNRERVQIHGSIVVLFDALFPIYKDKSERLRAKWHRVIEKRKSASAKK